MTYGNPLLYSGEKMHQDEFELMKSYYPETARLIQDKVERECEFQEKEPRRLNDENTDRMISASMAGRIKKEIEKNPKEDLSSQGMPGGFLDELIQVLLYQEISRRRCRRRRCRGY